MDRGLTQKIKKKALIHLIPDIITLNWTMSGGGVGGSVGALLWFLISACDFGLVHKCKWRALCDAVFSDSSMSVHWDGGALQLSKISPDPRSILYGNCLYCRRGANKIKSILDDTNIDSNHFMPIPLKLSTMNIRTKHWLRLSFHLSLYR